MSAEKDHTIKKLESEGRISMNKWLLLKKISRGAILLIMIKVTHSVGTLSKTIASICC